MKVIKLIWFLISERYKKYKKNKIKSIWNL